MLVLISISNIDIHRAHTLIDQMPVMIGYNSRDSCSILLLIMPSVQFTDKQQTIVDASSWPELDIV